MSDAASPPRTDWDRVTAIAAVLIGLVAVGVAAYTATLQRQQIRAQVWPRVLFYNAGMAGEFHIANKGVGPAVVRSVRVTVDGKPVRNWGQALTRLGLSDPAQKYSSLSGMVLSPGDDIGYLLPGDHAQFVALRHHVGDRLKLDLCYCSALDECWSTQNYSETLDDVQRPVDRCPAAGPGDFEN
ncbi:hypothetical protein LYSHEL_04640 [Lysobacter helvus]|uniref:DUF1850 domain-containing protein n=2 Tax=Lysobacteraceae TaxID=32033 RepID=A0ABM7Q2M6_9GAMM|nr:MULTISPECIES: hypothetical protein [Lysobacter]BCT91440.1 hypothetical protein LYSCAS_04640 [Lysobacter caseinilyticus]BCT94593.1 hypothetical protein LYSHEL_04640 [Lysobacter helvus]